METLAIYDFRGQEHVWQALVDRAEALGLIEEGVKVVDVTELDINIVAAR